MVQLQEGWKVEGVFNDACASEGFCPYYMGRDVQGGCPHFWVFRIRNGKVNGIDLGNTTCMYIGDTAKHSSFQDLLQNGSEGEIYKGTAGGAGCPGDPESQRLSNEECLSNRVCGNGYTRRRSKYSC